MKKILMIFIFISALLLSTNIASATIGKPGSIMPLQINNYQMQTTGLVITPSWRPAYIKWYLIDPSGDIKYMVQSDLDYVQQVGSGFNSATWSITENTGTMKIPAFAKTGKWEVRGRIYDVNKFFLLQWSNKAEFTGASFDVIDYSFTDNFFAPTAYIYINLGSNMLTGDLEFSFGLPEVFFLIAGIIIFIIIIMNIRVLLTRRKTYA
jgi:hypothetical protein